VTHLEVRRPKFDFTDGVPWVWHPRNPAFSFFMNATSIIAICFEQMIVAAVQEAKPRMTQVDVAAEATAFLRQEAQHSSSHRKHVSFRWFHADGLPERPATEVVAAGEEPREVV
jgi:predicted metal-dependent hydrolase